MRGIVFRTAAAGLALAALPAFSQSLIGTNVRVSTHNFFPGTFGSVVGPPPDVFQQNEPSIAVHPSNPNLIAVGMNDVRTFPVSGDAWQSLAVSTDGGAFFDFEALIPGFPTDTSPEGLASPIRGNRAASDPWLRFDNFNHLFFAFIAFQRTPPGRPDFNPADTNAIAVAKYDVAPGGVTYRKTVVVERGTVGLGRQEDKEAMTVDNTPTSPHHGNIYVCWVRFTGAQDHLKVARSSDRGETYSLSAIANATNLQGCNVVAAPNGDVFVSWRTFDKNPRVNNPNDSAIFVASSTDGGATFSAPVQVSTFVDYQQISRHSPPTFRVFSDTNLAADQHGVYLAWAQKNPVSGADVVVTRSKDGGVTWDAPVMPHLPSGHQIMPTLEAAGGKLSVAWYDSRNEPDFNAAGPVGPALDVFYNQADTTVAGPLAFGAEVRVTGQSFNPNLFGSIRAITPFIGDYIGLVATSTTAYVVWCDNRDINPALNAQEDADPTTNPPALINQRSRDSNIYFQKLTK